MATNGILAQATTPEIPAFDASKIATTGPTTYDPSEDALVSNQVNKLLSKDNPYLQQARTRALQASNARGLTNSSMAVTAGESAAYDAVMPIAQGDANSYFTAQRDNNATTNQFGRDANQYAREGYLAQYRAGVDAGSQQRDQQFTAGQNDLNRTQQVSLQKDQQTFSAGQSDLDRQQQYGVLAAQQQFSAGQSDLDRTQQRDLQTGQQTFAAGQNALDRQQQFGVLGAQQQFQAAQSNLDRAQQIALADKSTEAQQALQAAQQQFSAAQSTLDRAQQAGLQASSQTFQADQNAQQRAFQVTQDATSFNRELERLGVVDRINKSNMPIEYASGITTSTSNQINAIMTNPDISAVKDASGYSDKDRAISNAISYGNSLLAWGDSFYGGKTNAISLGATPAATPAPAPASTPAPAPAVAQPTAQQIQQAVDAEIARRAAAAQAASYYDYGDQSR